MGTTPTNFPPESVIPIGQPIVGTKIGLTAALATTVFFSAPTAGLYLVQLAVRVVATNGVGTLTATITTPHAGTLTQSSGDVQDANLATSTDGYSYGVAIWMTAGQTISVGVAAAGVTGTTYEVYLSATRLF